MVVIKVSIKLRLPSTDKNRLDIQEMLEFDLNYVKERIEKVDIEIKKIQKLSRAIAEMCVVKNLPSGDPCWIARLIGTYIEIPSVKFD